jgi:phage-related protein
MDEEVPRPVEWIGSSLTDVRAFPPAVRDDVGFALYQAQIGSRHRAAKPLKGLGSGVIEIVARHDGDTYRAVYTVRFGRAVYVLHAFQKKSRRGIGTPRHELDVIRRRLAMAAQHYEDNYARA